MNVIGSASCPLFPISRHRRRPEYDFPASIQLLPPRFSCAREKPARADKEEGRGGLSLSPLSRSANFKEALRSGFRSPSARRFSFSLIIQASHRKCKPISGFLYVFVSGDGAGEGRGRESVRLIKPRRFRIRRDKRSSKGFVNSVRVRRKQDGSASRARRGAAASRSGF